MTATHVKAWANNVETVTVVTLTDWTYTVTKQGRVIFQATLPLTASPRRARELRHLQESAARSAEMGA